MDPDGDEDMKYWTNFQLLNEVERICNENKISCWTKGHAKVAEEILYILKEINLSSKQSQEDKNLINSFKLKYFRVIKRFKPCKGNYSSKVIREFGN